MTDTDLAVTVRYLRTYYPSKFWCEDNSYPVIEAWRIHINGAGSELMVVTSSYGKTVIRYSGAGRAEMVGPWNIGIEAGAMARLGSVRSYIEAHPEVWQ